MKPQIEQSLSRKIIRNTIFNAVGRFWGILVALILTPYIIGHIGIERFGVLAIIGAITGYFGLFDFGIGTSFVKYIAEFYAKKDYEKINQVVNTGFIFYSVFAILIIILAFFIINPLLIFFKIPSHLYNEALFVFLLGIVLFGISNALSPFGAIQTGLQRMDITNKVTIALSIPSIVGTIFFLEKGYGLPGLMVNTAIFFVIGSIISIVIAFKILPELRFNPFLFTKEMFKRLFIFGFKVQVTNLAILINEGIDKLLIGHFLNLSLVGFYELGRRITMTGRSIPLLLISAVMPAAAEIEAKKNWEDLLELYFRGSKYLNIVAIPVMTFIFVTAPLIMFTWMGSKYQISILVIQILAPAHLINLLTGVGSTIANGIGKPGIAARVSVITIILNVVISIVLIIKLGFIGVIIGTSVSLFIGSLIFMNVFHKYLKSPFSLFVKKIVMKPLIASFVAGATIYTIYRLLGLDYTSLNRFVNLCLLCLTGIIFICIYMIIIFKMNYLDIKDHLNFTRIFDVVKTDKVFLKTPKLKNLFLR